MELIERIIAIHESGAPFSVIFRGRAEVTKFIVMTSFTPLPPVSFTALRHDEVTQTVSVSEITDIKSLR